MNGGYGAVWWATNVASGGFTRVDSSNLSVHGRWTVLKSSEGKGELEG